MRIATRSPLLPLDLFALSALSCLSILVASPATAIEFEDVSVAVGIDEFNNSWGASWGDYDADGDPDLWVSNHTKQPSLYINDGGTFTKTTVLDPGDSHGSQWVDLDNDGDLDLVELAGSSGGLESSPNKVFLNEGGTLVESAAAIGLALELGRGRIPFLFDWDGDGLIDLFFSALTRSDGLDGAGLFQQQPDGTFLRVAGVMPADDLANAPVWAQLTDSTLDGVMELATFNRLVDPPAQEGWKIYDISGMPFVDLSPVTGPPQMSGINDVAIYDFNGDLRPDQFLVRTGTDGSDLAQSSPTQLEVRIHPFDGGFGVDLETPGDAFFSIPTNWFWAIGDVRIGASGLNPAALDFVLDSQNPAHQGLAPFNPATDRGIYVGYDVNNGEWVLRNSGNSNEVNVTIATEQPITNIDTIGFTFPADTSLQDMLFTLGADGVFTDESVAAGLSATPCVGGVGGDFDNDMDVDVYLVCTETINNAANVLLENDGTGAFTVVPGAGGAAGSGEGRGEAVTTADYDGDGFLDVFTTNGSGWPPFNLGPHELFRNLGNANHWIEVDLVGSISNRDAIGASIVLTSGGVPQLREHTGGMHNRSQDHQRIHFGLGANTLVDSMVIEWPSGITQTITNVPADQIVEIVEPGPACDVEISQPVYVNTQTVALSRVRFANPGIGVSLATRIRLSLEIPNGQVFPMIDIGGDGSVTLPPGALIDLPTLPFLPVTANSPPRGNYKVSCEMMSPANGRVWGSDSVSFVVQ